MTLKGAIAVILCRIYCLTLFDSPYVVELRFLFSIHTFLKFCVNHLILLLYSTLYFLLQNV